MLIFLTCISDQIIGRILRHLYFSQTSGLYYRTTYSIDSTKADILVFGSSRASHHYVPEIFEETLNLEFYNTGRDGNFLLFNYATFKAVINRYSPGIVIFDINPDELAKNEQDYERLSSLLPYYRDHPEIRSIVELKSPYEKYKLLSEIYPFNSSLLTIIIGNLEVNRDRKGDRKGYVPLTGLMQDTVFHKLSFQEGGLDINKIKSIKDIIRYCDSNDIALFFIQSPIYAQVGNTLSLGYLAKVTRESNVIFWDLSDHPDILSKPEFFQDQDHLNDTGAAYFSEMVVNRISAFLTQRVAQN
jgi:hypothetical protein